MIMKIPSLLQFLIFLLFFLIISSSSHAKFIPRFPSSLISPEKLSLSTAKNHQLYKTRYFTQILDHFNYNPQSYQKFQQRYLINDTFWGGAKKNYPIFVYTGNEGDIEWFAQNTGFMYDIAPKFKALLVFIEVLPKLQPKTFKLISRDLIFLFFSYFCCIILLSKQESTLNCCGKLNILET